MKKHKEKYKVIDYIKARDEALKAMVMFRKMGNDEMANEYLKLAANINSVRKDISPIALVSL